MLDLALHRGALPLEERLQFRQRFLGSAFLKVVATVDRLSADLGAFFLPDSEHIVEQSRIKASTGPESQQRTGDFLSGLDVGVIDLQIHGRRGAIVLAHAVLHLEFHAVARVLALSIVGETPLRLAFRGGDQVVFGAGRR